MRGGAEAGLRLGVGKAEQESFFICADNVTRKRLEAEVQAEEDYERTLRREVHAAASPCTPLANPSYHSFCMC